MNILIFGNGMVGHRFIEEMVGSKTFPNYQLITFSEEFELAYGRGGLSSYFAGITRRDLSLEVEGYYDKTESPSSAKLKLEMAA
jgi:nitrite reductase (NADH) large subunit